MLALGETEREIDNPYKRGREVGCNYLVVVSKSKEHARIAKVTL